MLTPDALATLMAAPAPHAVLDVRERGAYERGHVFRSTSLPRRQLETRLPGLVTALDTPLVVLDADGTLAPLAAATATAMGYRDLRMLDGGLAAWRRAGRPLVQGVNVPSKVFGEHALHAMKTPQIAPHGLARRIERGDDLVIVDARTVEEYTRGCIPGAISVPVHPHWESFPTATQSRNSPFGTGMPPMTRTPPCVRRASFMALRR